MPQGELKQRIKLRYCPIRQHISGLNPGIRMPLGQSLPRCLSFPESDPSHNYYKFCPLARCLIKVMACFKYLAACVLLMLASYSSCSQKPLASKHRKRNERPDGTDEGLYQETFTTVQGATGERPLKRTLFLDDGQFKELSIHSVQTALLWPPPNPVNSETASSSSRPFDWNLPIVKESQTTLQGVAAISPSPGDQNPSHPMPISGDSKDFRENKNPSLGSSPSVNVDPPSMPSQRNTSATGSTVNFGILHCVSQVPGATGTSILGSMSNGLNGDSPFKSPYPKTNTRGVSQAQTPAVVQQISQVSSTLEPKVPSSQPLIDPTIIPLVLPWFPPPPPSMVRAGLPPNNNPSNVPNMGTASAGKNDGDLRPPPLLLPRLMDGPQRDSILNPLVSPPLNASNNQQPLTNVTTWLDIFPFHTRRPQAQLGQRQYSRVMAPSVPRSPDTYVPLRPYSAYLKRQCDLGDFEALEDVEAINGTFGSVYPVRDRQTHEIFAMKKIVAQKVKKHVNAVISEETIHYELDHPNIARFHCTMVSLDTGDVYFLLEYVDGKNLYHHMADLGKGVTTEEIGPVIGQISLALRYLHERNIVHRDVKPENIMLMPSGTAKLVDFGLAVLCEQDNLKQPAGTAYTAAPEVFAAVRGEGTYGRAADYYSLGSVAFTMFTCTRLHGGTDKKCFEKRCKTKTGMTKVPIPRSKQLYELLNKLLTEDKQKRWLEVYINFASYQRLEIFKNFTWGSLGLLPLPKDEPLNSEKSNASSQ